MTMTTIARVLAVAAVGLTAAAAPALAQARDYRGYGYDDGCQGRIHNNGTTGALLGGVAGALIGSNVAHGGGRTGGALIGAAAGAAVGSNIARSSTKQNCRGPSYRTSYRDYGYQPGYYADPGYGDYNSYPVYNGYSGYSGYSGYGYERGHDEHHDRGEHRGWYKHHDHDDEGDGD
jgi:hypothetical protein